MAMMIPTLEQIFANVVPYGNRPAQPPWHFPVHLAICILGTALPVGKEARLLVVLPAVLYSTFSRITYTTGAVKDDYFNALQFLVVTLNFVNHAVLRPYLVGREPRFIGSKTLNAEQTPTRSSKKSPSPKPQGQALSDCRGFGEKLLWAIRLLTTFRGIGWNWEIKKVPQNPDLHLSKRQAAVRHLRRLGTVFLLHAIYLYCMTFISTVQSKMRNRDDFPDWQRFALRVLHIWSVQLWMIESSKIIYHGLAAVTLATKIQSPSDWPPYWGPWMDWWSVRNVWGSAYHQFYAETFSLYSSLVTSVLGLKKGSLASRYTKLYTGFYVSVLIHQWLSFCAAPDEQGSFYFFMSQAVVIHVEDIGRWAWRKLSGRKEEDKMNAFERVFGYVWTFCWFTTSWQVDTFFDMGLVEPMAIEPDVRGIAARHALHIFK